MIKNKAYQEIGARIRELREKDGLSQQELAEQVGFKSATAISLIESGARKVAVDDLKKIAELFGEPVSSFLDEESTSQVSIRGALRADSSISPDDRKILENLYKRFREKGKK